MKFSDTVKFVTGCVVGFPIGYAIQHTRKCILARKLAKQKQEKLEILKELDRQNEELEELIKVFEERNIQQIKLEKTTEDLFNELRLLHEERKEAD